MDKSQFISVPNLVTKLRTINEKVSSLTSLERKGKLDENGHTELIKVRNSREQILQQLHEITHKAVEMFKIAGRSCKRYRYLFSGTFDPFTYGHMSELDLYLKNDPSENIIVAMGVSSKKPIFSTFDRKFIIESYIPEEFKHRVRVDIVEGSMKIHARKNSVISHIRSVRGINDVAYESDLAAINDIIPGSMITSINPQTDPKLNIVSSSNLKLLSSLLGVNLEHFASPFVREVLKMKMSGKLVIGINGGIASGKSTICKKLQEYSKDQDVKIHYFDMDKLGHEILDETKQVSPMYEDTRDKIEEEFGPSVRNPDGTINRKILGDIVFSDNKEMAKLNNIMGEPVMVLLCEKLSKLGEGIILLENALLVEKGLTNLCDENIINVRTSPDIQIQRMQKRNRLTQSQAEKRLKSQLSQEEVLSKIEKVQSGEFDRLYLEINTDGDINDFNEAKIYKLLEKEYLRRKEVRRFGDLFIPEGIAFDDDNLFIQTMAERYSEDHRHYHNLKHIEEMLYLFQKVRAEYKKMGKTLPHENEIYLAIMFHDIIYDLKNKHEKSNEQLSAEFAREYLKEHLINENIDIDLVCELIELTGSHIDPNKAASNLEEFKKIFLDADMTIFAAEAERLDEYEYGILQEYTSIYPKDQYLEGRKHALKNILKKREIYHSDFFKTKYDEKAWDNIMSLIEIIIREQARMAV